VVRIPDVQLATPAPLRKNTAAVARRARRSGAGVNARAEAGTRRDLRSYQTGGPRARLLSAAHARTLPG
jgi:hypothetical protein